MQRPDLLGVRWMPSAQVNRSSTEVLEWLGQRGVGRWVMVHLDLGGLEPEELKIAVASDPGGLGLAATSRLINALPGTVVWSA